MPTTLKSVLSLDVGSTRIGVSVASFNARLARPLTTVLNDEKIFDRLLQIIEEEGVRLLVIGYPRGLAGQITEQTKIVESFGKQCQSRLHIPVVYQDESVTSITAEAELKQHRKSYPKERIDAIAATIILEDYLNDHMPLEGDNA